MLTQTARLAMATALLGFGLGVGGRAEATLLSTPTGLNPGDTLRFVFVTDGTTQAISPDIGY